MSIYKLFNIEKNINETIQQRNSYVNYVKKYCFVRKIRLLATTIYLMCGTEKGENLFLISNPYSAKNFAELIYLSIYNKKQRINSINVFIQGGVNAGQEFIRKNDLKALFMLNKVIIKQLPLLIARVVVRCKIFFTYSVVRFFSPPHKM